MHGFGSIMNMMVSRSFARFYVIPAATLLGSFLVACSPKPTLNDTQNMSADDSIIDLKEGASAEPKADQQDGKKLTELSGQATLPYDNSAEVAPVPEHAKVFIGRFHAQVSCDDSFIQCKEGEAEFILNLLPDGTVHRSIIQFGKVFAEKNQTSRHKLKYQKDTWSVNKAHTELIVQRKEGVNLYYKIIDENHLVMDVEKILQGGADRNQELFSQGYPKPQRAYQLTKNKYQ